MLLPNSYTYYHLLIGSLQPCQILPWRCHDPVRCCLNSVRCYPRFLSQSCLVLQPTVLPGTILVLPNVALVLPSTAKFCTQICTPTPRYLVSPAGYCFSHVRYCFRPAKCCPSNPALFVKSLIGSLQTCWVLPLSYQVLL